MMERKENNIKTTSKPTMAKRMGTRWFPKLFPRWFQMVPTPPTKSNKTYIYMYIYIYHYIYIYISWKHPGNRMAPTWLPSAEAGGRRAKRDKADRDVRAGHPWASHSPVSSPLESSLKCYQNAIEMPLKCHESILECK